jgi:predicted TIM-barrel fold metal-dependent hydrolase
MARIDVAGGVGQLAFRNLIELFRHEHCWIKVSCADRISSPPYAAAVPFARALIDAKPHGVLWGTDFPHPNVDHPVDEADLVDLLPAFAPDENDRRRLLVENPAILFGM